MATPPDCPHHRASEGATTLGMEQGFEDVTDNNCDQRDPRQGKGSGRERRHLDRQRSPRTPWHALAGGAPFRVTRRG